jgi:3-deoxy-manno-octulosonate cytidylyltransferase (CMP-KDO synthetase)
VQCFYDKEVQIATMVKRINSIDEFQNPNVVKAVLASNGNALYFSRSALPYIRNGNIKQAIADYPVYKHIGMYAYRDGVLPELTRLKPSVLELAESLEQLRWLQNGYTIRAIETTTETIAIDAPEDLAKAEAYLSING